MLNLSWNRSRTLARRHGQFLRRRASSDTATPAVIADAAVSGKRYLIAINIVNHRGVDIGYRAVIEQMAMVPIGAKIATACIAAAVVDAAIEADVRAPKGLVPYGARTHAPGTQ
jgi:UDP-3-O-[3-hydroxymyristoyl] glucosamine N-acyltransferase